MTPQDPNKRDNIVKELIFFPITITLLLIFTLYIRSCNPSG